jgi:plastocyanin
MRTNSQRPNQTVVHASNASAGALTVTRRHALALLGGAAMASAGMLSLNQTRARAQEGGTPVPMVTPEFGPQADGSTMWRVQVGEMNMEEQYEFHAFFPGEITINEGDSIWFDFGMGGFHTVTFLSGAEPPMLWITDPGGATPEAGTEPTLFLNPDLVFETGGTAYDGTSYVSSGIDVFRDPTIPYVVTFSKAGTYDYECVIHRHVMFAKVIVQAAGSELASTQEDYDAVSADEKAALEAMVEPELEKYREATSTANADGTTAWTATVGAGGETQLRVQQILPKELEIKVGDSVTWINQAYGEPHTVSFLGAGEAPPEDVTVEMGADGMPRFVQSPLTLRPQGGDVWSGTGWVNSGFLGYPASGSDVREYTLTFDTPGDYIYFCALHGDSEGNGMAAMLHVLPA